jgi:hypothetical protein
MAEHGQEHPREGNRDGLHKIAEIIEVIEDGDIVEVVEIEIYGRENRKPPKAKKYHIRIDKEPKVVGKQHITGMELLELIGKKPDAWRLYQRGICKCCGRHRQLRRPFECRRRTRCRRSVPEVSRSRSASAIRTGPCRPA